MKSDEIAEPVPSLMVQHIEIFICPACGGTLNVCSGRRMIECASCNRYFRSEKGISLLLWRDEREDDKTDVTDRVKSFYEENPFPNYEDSDSSSSLREQAEKGIFARLLDDQIPYGARILEVGCGTGQLSNFLALTWGRTVFATDICLNSLKLGQEFKERNHLDNVAFLQMNLFHPVFRRDSFDLVICNGVLHHTSDPFLGFQSISKVVKKGGFIIVGLYNTYSRVPTIIRRFLFELLGDRFSLLDPRLHRENLSNTRKNIWFMDQYKNPHESTHTFGEVLRWFDRTGFEFTRSVPKSMEFQSFSQEEKLFQANPRGTRLDHLFVQLSMLLSGGREGGFFIMIGRKKF